AAGSTQPGARSLPSRVPWPTTGSASSPHGWAPRSPSPSPARWSGSVPRWSCSPAAPSAPSGRRPPEAPVADGYRASGGLRRWQAVEHRPGDIFERIYLLGAENVDKVTSNGLVVGATGFRGQLAPFLGKEDNRAPVVLGTVVAPHQAPLLHAAKLV